MAMPPTPTPYGAAASGWLRFAICFWLMADCRVSFAFALFAIPYIAFGSLPQLNLAILFYTRCFFVGVWMFGTNIILISTPMLCAQCASS